MQKRKALSLLLALVMVLGLSVPALAAEDFSITDGVLTKYNGPGGDVVIPDGVTNIGSLAFQDCTNLTSITIPNSVTSIKGFAFRGCTSLADVTIGNSVTSIGEQAFSRCTSLAEITIPNSVTSIGDGAFSDCTSLTSVAVLGNVTNIGSNAFHGCTNLTSVTMPESTSNIEFCTFQGCENLTSVVIPKGVTSIGDRAFNYCLRLTNVTIPDSVTTIEESAFEECLNLTSIAIPDSVTTIGKRAFHNLSYVISPDGATIKLGLTDVYYGGSQTQWEAVAIGDGNDSLENATIHYNSAMPVPQSKAQPSTQTVNVDGKKVEFAMYALNNGSVNYIRVRDLAALLNGTAAQFEVGWDGKVVLTGKTAYTGSTDKAPFNTEMPYTVYTEPTYVNGSPVTLDAIQIDYNGGGYTYYKLRDLAEALNFDVSWSAEKGVYVETDKPYDPAN